MRIKKLLLSWSCVMLSAVMISSIFLNLYTNSRASATKGKSGLPVIVDDTNTITENQRERLLNQFAEEFTDIDLSMYTLSFSKVKSETQTDYSRIGFDVYYNDMYVYDGFESGDASTNSVVCIGTYNGTDFERIFSKEFYEKCLEINLSNIISIEDVRHGLVDNTYVCSDETVEIELIIYNDLTDKLGSDVVEVAYKAKLIRDEEEIVFIIDAETNEVLLQESNILYNDSESNGSVSYTYSESGFELKCTITNNTVTINEINVIQATELEIPDTINGRPVVAIADNAFLYSQMHLDSIIIPEGVTSIGEKAFVGQHGAITTVILPKSIESIGEYAIGYFQNGITYILDSTTVVQGYADTIAELYAINNNIAFQELNGMVEILAGDVNSDGKFTIADVLLFQKWLLTVPDANLANWKAADLCQDNVLNVFDLCLMKKMLLSNLSSVNA